MFFSSLAPLVILGLSTGISAIPHPLQSRAENDTSTHKFLTNKTQPYAVDGANLPDIPFDIGESYSGLMPIGDKAGRELFFWFVPSENEAADDEIVIWLNGGPGCSSLMGFLQENGPISWQSGQLAPMRNVYSWTNLTNVIWVEQPAGTAFSGAKGDGDNEDEVGVAQQFLGFWKNFIDTFDMKGRKVSITGESYAGNYVPYIAEAMLNTTGEEATDYYNVTGILIYDPILGDRTLGDAAPAVEFINANKNLFPFDEADFEALNDLNKECGFHDLMEQANTFPPKGPIKIPKILELNATSTTESSFGNEDCYLNYFIEIAIMELNPCFNIYYVGQPCPYPGDIIGDPYHTNAPGSPQLYFTRADVQKAIHAPTAGNGSAYDWSICSNATDVFADGIDRSLPSASNGGPLGRVIERTNNVIVGHGTLDMVLMVNGSLLALQNLTWNGEQGFSKPLDNDLVVPYYPQGVVAQSGNGTLGKWTEDRGLIFCTVEMSGHEVPGYQPGVALRHLEKLLGRIDRLDDEGDFSTASTYFEDGFEYSPRDADVLRNIEHQLVRRDQIPKRTMQIDKRGIIGGGGY
ncbi:hypothetical protein PV08_08086 [Exophiala spinifera]|uniref:Carboxypeptidase n=1 Tax=Exophiala spinifera TaxID=91928 RepID=A0A0D2BP77_9EURO|nr:uncharacterized protein PV08_08086 [Exophiala spinifera]KIW12899.1 hypothetical protein PV08_08086 [Exophiala spinifera]